MKQEHGLSQAAVPGWGFICHQRDGLSPSPQCPPWALTLPQHSRAVAGKPTAGTLTSLVPPAKSYRDHNADSHGPATASPRSCASTTFAEKIQGSKNQTCLMNVFIVLLTPFLIHAVKQQPALCHVWKQRTWTTFSQLHSKALCTMKKRQALAGRKKKILTNSLSGKCHHSWWILILVPKHYSLFQFSFLRTLIGGNKRKRKKKLRLFLVSSLGLNKKNIQKSSTSALGRGKGQSDLLGSALCRGPFSPTPRPQHAPHAGSPCDARAAAVSMGRRLTGTRHLFSFKSLKCIKCNVASHCRL